MSTGALHVRPALIADVAAMVALEESSFSTDRMARRHFLRFLRGQGSAVLVAEVDDRFAGYVLVLFRANTKSARIYSVAVSPTARGRGVGEQLVQAAEAAARARHRQLMRLEVRPDNQAAIRLYERQGYRQFGHFPAFYEDGTDALRLEKRLG